MAGRIPGRRCASMLLPVPGGPIISRLWPPAAAISSARRARGWPRTSARSGPLHRADACGGLTGLRQRPHAAREAADLEQVRGAVGSPIPGQRGLGEVGGRKHLRVPRPRTLQRGRQHAADRMQLTAERQLAVQLGRVERFHRQLRRSDQDAHRDRQVEAASLLRQVRRREVDRDVAGRQLEPAVGQRRLARGPCSPSPPFPAARRWKTPAGRRQRALRRAPAVHRAPAGYGSRWWQTSRAVSGAIRAASMRTRPGRRSTRETAGMSRKRFR